MTFIGKLMVALFLLVLFVVGFVLLAAGGTCAGMLLINRSNGEFLGMAGTLTLALIEIAVGGIICIACGGKLWRMATGKQPKPVGHLPSGDDGLQ
jgi:hypothetical protein